MGIIAILLFIGACIFVICFAISDLIYNKDKNENIQDKKQIKGIVNKLNYNATINKLGKIINNPDLIKIFNRAKNPWRMTIPTFQFIRFGGILLFSILSIFSFSSLGNAYGVLTLSIACLFFFYPIYYYKATGNEREAEWNKMYEFIWILKHNIMLYDPAKAFMNTKIYIEEHSPQNKEIIKGFEDFYSHWDPNEMSAYIEQYYPFSVTREIYQIIFNMNKTGEFPEESLNSLRGFIINAQNLTVEKTLAAVSGKATIFSLPFLMVSVIVALMVPLISQILNFL